MLVSELRDKCIYPWEPVLIDIDGSLWPIVFIGDSNVHVGNTQEPLFAYEILEELEGKDGKLEIVK